MLFKKKEVPKEIVQGNFTTIECQFGDTVFAIFPRLYKKITEPSGAIRLEEIVADKLDSQSRVYLKRYFLGKYAIDEQPPAKKIEDIIDDIKLCFEPISHLMQKYPNAITFHSNENDKNKPLPYVINIDIAVLDNFIKDLL